MTTLNLNESQSKQIAKVITGDIKDYANTHFDRLLAQFMEERNNGNGKPLDPIRITFSPYSYLSDNNPTEVGGGSNG